MPLDQLFAAFDCCVMVPLRIISFKFKYIKNFALLNSPQYFSVIINMVNNLSRLYIS